MIINNLHFKNNFVRLFSIILVLFSSNAIFATQGINHSTIDIQTTVVNQSEVFDASNFINDIIASLSENAVYENGTLIGWIQPYFINMTTDFFMLNGYQSGMAGIGDFLIDAYLEGFENALPLLTDIVDRLKSKYTTDPGGGIYWGKYSNFNSEGWIGNRYGNMGINKFLARMHFEGLGTGLETLISQSYEWTKNQQLESGNWPIAPDSYTTTDQEYGAAGVASSLILLSKYLDDSFYLDEAIDIVDWILENGNYVDDIFYIDWTLEGEGTEFEGRRTTGIGTGISGVMSLMIDIYELTGDLRYYQVVEGIANDLMDADFGGYWPWGSLKYITNLVSSNTGLTGYFAGGSGIASELLRAYDLTKNSTYLKSSIRAEKWLENFIQDDGSVTLGLFNPDRYYTGLTLGSSGVAKYFVTLYTRYFEERQADHATLILSHLHDLLKFHGMMPVEENALGNGFSFTIADGLAGIGTVLIDYIKNQVGELSHSDNIDMTYRDVYTSVTPLFESPQQTTDTSKSNESSFFNLWVGFLSYFIIVSIKKIHNNKMKSHSNY
ncbi:MAG: lanthionine synthetase LanC family protein [Candidatus Kariarchaeaceae archaeon]